MLNMLIWLSSGAVLGFVLSRWLRPNQGNGPWPNVAVGAGAALLVGLLVMPYLGTPGENREQFSLGTLLASLVGSLAVLLIFNVVRASHRTR